MDKIQINCEYEACDSHLYRVMPLNYAVTISSFCD